jgi:predicted metallo-beta-lactamase superfamily hydrolase
MIPYEVVEDHHLVRDSRWHQMTTIMTPYLLHLHMLLSLMEYHYLGRPYHIEV